MGRWRRHNNTRNGCGSMRVDRDVENAINTLLARGPFCDLHNTRYGFVRPNDSCQSVLMAVARQVSAIHAWAQLGCRRLRSSLGASQRPMPPRWHFELCLSQRVRTFPYSFETWCFVVGEEAHRRFCHVRVSPLHARDAVSPTGPMRGLCTARCRTQAQTSQIHGDSSNRPRLFGFVFFFFFLCICQPRQV